MQDRWARWVVSGAEIDKKGRRRETWWMKLSEKEKILSGRAMQCKQRPWSMMTDTDRTVTNTWSASGWANVVQRPTALTRHAQLASSDWVVVAPIKSLARNPLLFSFPKEKQKNFWLRLLRVRLITTPTRCAFLGGTWCLKSGTWWPWWDLVGLAYSKVGLGGTWILKCGTWILKVGLGYLKWDLDT